MRENSLRFAKGLSEAGSSVSSLDRAVGGFEHTVCHGHLEGNCSCFWRLRRKSMRRGKDWRRGCFLFQIEAIKARLGLVRCDHVEASTIACHACKQIELGCHFAKDLRVGG